MKKDKVIQYLDQFSPEQNRRFRAFVYSPYFNKSEKLQQLYDYISENTLLAPDGGFDDRTAFETIYPGDDYNPNKLRILKSKLCKLIVDFLGIDEFQSQAGMRAAMRLRGSNRLANPPGFATQYKRAKTDLLDAGGMDQEYYFSLFQLEHEYEKFLVARNGRGKPNNLQALGQAMEQFILPGILKHCFVVSNQIRIIGEGSIPQWMAVLIDQIDPGTLQDQPLSLLYYYLYQTSKYPGRAAPFSALRSNVFRYASQLDQEEMVDVLTGTVNNFLRSTYSVAEKKNQEVLEVYRFMYQVVVRDCGRRLHPFHLKNIVILGVRAGEYSWVRSFIEEAAIVLDADDAGKIVARHFNLGVLEFYESRFSDAESQFHIVLQDTTDIFYEMASRAYLLMIYYEMGNTMGMESLVHSFRMFIQRSKRISDAHRANYLHFLRLFRGLIGTPPNDHSRLQKLKAGVESLDELVGRSWLSAKVEGLLSA